MSLICYILTGTTLQIGVSLNGPQLVKRYDSLYLNCSSDNTPIDSAANLRINDIYYTSIRRVNGNCFSSVLERECLPGNCDCSEESLWFGHFYNVTQPEGVVDISCSMVFGIQGTFLSSIQVTIIGNYRYICYMVWKDLLFFLLYSHFSISIMSTENFFSANSRSNVKRCRLFL